MKLRKLFVLVFVLVLSVALVACGNKDKEDDADTFKIAVVTDVGQLMDGGFNQGTYEGAVAFATENKMTYKYYQPAGGSGAKDNDRIAAMRQAIENGAEVIVTPGFLQAAAISAVAEESPNVKFVFVDGWALGTNKDTNYVYDNVTAVSYKEQESGYFAGYAAVMDGYTNLGGTFGGGGTNSACNRFAYGYVQGANDAAAKLIKTVDVKISFNHGNDFSASPELKTQISGWYNAGTQVVFSCGGSMLQSVKAAAAEVEGAKIIGVDVDQASESDAVITSAVKGLAVSVKKILTDWKNGKWDTELKNQCSVLGAADDSTGLPTAQGSWRFETFTVEEYNQLFESVKSGLTHIESEVPANMNEASVWEDINGNLAFVNIAFE